MEHLWLKTADELLQWILVVDRIIGRGSATSCSS
jgi:hypothetical protein